MKRGTVLLPPSRLSGYPLAARRLFLRDESVSTTEHLRGESTHLAMAFFPGFVLPQHFG